MPRKKRAKAESGIYHVMLRGINKQNVFLDDDDYMTMMRCLADLHLKRDGLGKIVSKSECSVLAFALLPNHVHILLKEGDESLSHLMQRLEDRFVFFYNKKYDRCGHLFQDRFKSEPVDTEDYFRTLLRYIHWNPVKALLCRKLEGWMYSSWREYVDDGRDAVIDVCHKRIVLERIPLEELHEWVRMEVDDKCMDMDTERFVKTDRHAWDILADVSGEDNAEEFKQLSVELQLKYVRMAVEKGVSMRQASRLSILSYSKIQRELSCRKVNQGVRPLGSILEGFKDNGRLTIPALAEKIGMSVYACRKMVHLLEKQGYLARSGNGRSTEWKVLKDWIEEGLG